MAALTDTKNIDEKASNLGSVSVASGKKIYRGAFVKIQADGYGAPEAAEAGGFFAGVAQETIDNSSGADGDLDCQIQRVGQFLVDGQSGFAVGDVGSPVYASDDQTISTTQGANEHQIGKISEFVSASSVWVELTPLV